MTLEFDPPLDPDPRINVALLGPPKTGKTAGAASAPGPVLYLNADLPARMRFTRRLYGDKVRSVTMKGQKTLVDATYAVHSGDYATVVLDPVGDAFRILLEDRLGGRVPETMSKPVLNQYRVVSDELRRFCTAMCKAPVNFVVVFHDMPVQDETSGETERLPDAGTSNPKLGRQIMGMADIVGYTHAVERDGKPVYVAQLVPLRGRPGGDSFDCLLEEGKQARELDLTEWIEVIKADEAGSDAAS